MYIMYYIIYRYIGMCRLYTLPVCKGTGTTTKKTKKKKKKKKRYFLEEEELLLLFFLINNIILPVVLIRIIKNTVRMECKENKKTANNNMND